jgi:hypothetical protein
MKTDLEFSLLYPPGSPRSTGKNRWGENTVEDLGINLLAWDLSLQNKYQPAIQTILLELCSDIDTLTYRQQVLQDFLDLPALSSALQELLPALAKLNDYAEARSQKGPLPETLGRLTELNAYITCVRKLQAILSAAGAGASSRGLAALAVELGRLAEDETFISLENGLPELLAKLNTVPSITIGINLDSELNPVEAALLAIHDKPFRDNTLFGRLLGKAAGQNFEHPIGPMHEVPYLMVNGIDTRVVRIPDRADPHLVPLFRDLFDILRNILDPIARGLKQYAQVNARLLIQLEGEIAFYLGAVALIRRIQAAGLPMCSPQAVSLDARICSMQGMVNLILAQHQLDASLTTVAETIVPNDVDFGPQGRIFILTGPNQGGKTVFTQGIGLAQVLFQAGLYVPAQSARISPVDGIYTHFTTLEKTGEGTGRLAEEAKRLNEIFQSISDKSLVLLNESLSSTSPGESLYLARDIVRALKLFGVRAIFATHLHELAEDLDQFNASLPGDSRLVSLVAGVISETGEQAGPTDAVRSTYQIKPGPPRGLSYAHAIAVRYGISYEQLEQGWRSRQSSSQPG